MQNIQGDVERDLELAYNNAKNTQSWREVISIAQRASSVLLDDARAAIWLSRAASSHFYLGEYDDALASAHRALEASGEDIGSKARALYLISACHRVQKNWGPALESIEEAIGLEVDDSTKQKIFFNAGALYQEMPSEDQSNPKRNLERAVGCFQQAFALAEPGSDEHNRASIRHAKCLLELGRIAEARAAFKQITSVQDGTRTYIHLQQLEGHILLKENRFAEAYDAFDSAKMLAQELKALADVTRLEGFMQEALAGISRHEEYMREIGLIREAARSEHEQGAPDAILVFSGRTTLMGHNQDRLGDKREINQTEDVERFRLAIQISGRNPGRRIPIIFNGTNDENADTLEFLNHCRAGTALSNPDICEYLNSHYPAQASNIVAEFAAAADSFSIRYGKNAAIAPQSAEGEIVRTSDQIESLGAYLAGEPLCRVVACVSSTYHLPRIAGMIESYSQKNPSLVAGRNFILAGSDLQCERPGVEIDLRCEPEANNYYKGEGFWVERTDNECVSYATSGTYNFSR